MRNVRASARTKYFIDVLRLQLWVLCQLLKFVQMNCFFKKRFWIIGGSWGYFIGVKQFLTLEILGFFYTWYAKHNFTWGDIQCRWGQIEHKKLRKTEETQKTQKTGILCFPSFLMFGSISHCVGWISPPVKSLSVLYARREVMSHQCDCLLLDILGIVFYIKSRFVMSREVCNWSEIHLWKIDDKWRKVPYPTTVISSNKQDIYISIADHSINTMKLQSRCMLWIIAVVRHSIKLEIHLHQRNL